MKNFVCHWPECDQRFSRNQLLTLHMNKHQNIKPFKCTYNKCSYQFFYPASVAKHIKNYHQSDQ